MSKLKNAYLYILLFISVLAYLAGCYMVGYRINTLIGAALIVGAISYIAAFYAANWEVAR